jgi:hypothetical protein
MANTFIVTQIISQGGQISINGTVNGNPVSAVTTSVGWPPPTAIAFESLVGSLLLACVPASTTTLAALTSSWSS